MFDPKLKIWVSGDYPEDVLKQCEAAVHKKDPGSLFILADHYLSEGRKGNHTADAVYAMETAAEMKYIPAVLAMGQMYHHGWGVHKSHKKALYWYEIAAGLGNEEAAAYLNKLRRQKKLAILSGVLTVTAAAAAVALVLILPKLLPNSPAKPVPSVDSTPEPTLPEGVLVGDDTELITVTSALEFSASLAELMEENDTELVITGEQSTNRLILRFEGSGIDLSAFPAATVIANEDTKLVIIQFASEAEAKACLEALKNMANIEFAATDEYEPCSASGLDTPNIRYDQVNTSIPTYHSQYTGFDYYTWGATFLEIDQMVAWTMSQSNQSITVAVVDTGTLYYQDFGDCLLPGADLAVPSNPNGQTDNYGHGTHVAGTILDCTQGLDVKVLPCRVFQGEYTSAAVIALGIEYATDEKVDVINLSLGGPCHPAKESAVSRAMSEGIVVVISAGNDAVEIESNDVCPAHITDAITVSACDSTGALAGFTNYGDAVDVCAPGVEVLSYYLDGYLATLNGTSMAAPHISAMAAVILAHSPNKTMGQIEKYLGDYALNPGSADYYGEGIPLGRYFAGD